MTRFRVGFAPGALDQIERVQSWWRQHRVAAPTLFDDELLAAVRRLETAFNSGSMFAHPRVTDQIRRVFMPRCRYHVYYTIDEEASLVWIVAVWHSSRRQGPPL